MVKKKGEKYECENCGLVVLVEDPCGCDTCELVCCEQPMKQVRETKATEKPAKTKK